MRNRIPTYPGRVHLAPVEGQANVFDLTRADQPQDPGTPLNKGTLLSDDVEALIWGAAADRTPNDAFGKVSELYQHWWSILHGEAYSYWEEVRTPWVDTQNMYLCIGQGNLQYSKQISIDSAGKVTLVNPITLEADWSLASVQAYCKTLVEQAPVYVTNFQDTNGVDTTQIMRIPEGATYYTTTSGVDGTSNYTLIGKYYDHPSVYFGYQAPEAIRPSVISSQLVTVPAGETTYVHSPDRNAYPDSGTVDGLTYKYLGVPFENARGAGKVEHISYTGTGTSGASNPTKLTANFEIKAALVMSPSARFYSTDSAMNSFYFFIAVKGMTRHYVDSTNYVEFLWNANELSYYGTTPTSQMNSSGTTYNAILLG